MVNVVCIETERVMSRLVECLKREIFAGNLNYRFTPREAWKVCAKYRFKRSTFGVFFSKHRKSNKQGQTELFVEERVYRLKV